MLTKLPLLLIVISLSINMSVYAAVDIFDSRRGSPIAQKGVNNKAAKIKASGKQKVIDIMFIGASQVNGIKLYFRDKKNKQISLLFDENKKNSLPGYDDLRIKKVENRILFVEDSKGKYCQNNSKKGIYCQDNGIIEMKIVRKFVAPRNKIIKRPKTTAKKVIKSPFGQRAITH